MSVGMALLVLVMVGLPAGWIGFQLGDAYHQQAARHRYRPDAVTVTDLQQAAAALACPRPARAAAHHRNTAG